MSEFQQPEMPPSPPPIPPVQCAPPVGVAPGPGKPNWPKVVGIIGIIFGTLGLLGGVQLMVLPKTLETQQGIMVNMQEMAEKTNPDQPDFNQPPKELFNVFNKMFDTPEWFGSWCLFGGALAAIISGGYVFAAIRLIQLKPGAPSLFCLLAGLAVVLAAARVAVGISVGSLMSISLVVGAVFGGIADGALLCVVASSDKKMFDDPAI